MKKITFILFALLSGTAFGQATATESATGTAEIVKPIGITNTGSSILDFGKVIVPTGASGSVQITAAAAPVRNLTGLDVIGTTFSSAEFAITASANNNYKITIPETELSGPGDPMPLVPISNLPLVSNKGDQILYVGGTLTVNDGQTEGTYSGIITVTVEYE